MNEATQLTRRKSTSSLKRFRSTTMRYLKKSERAFHLVIFGNSSIEKETEKLRDSTESSSRNRRESPQYNFDLLNEMSAKIKSCDDISIEDLQLLIFLVQLTISDMKSVGRGGKGYSLQAYELRRRGFKVNPKELLDFLEK